MITYKPLVTIIIPVYNGANFLSEAIESALMQTYSNLEIIVVNDGSIDEGKTDEIALSYGNKIKYLVKENGGVSSALNYALNHASGEWFSWLSHDDLYFPNKIEAQISFLNQLVDEDPEIDLGKTVLHSATVSIDANGRIIKRPSYRSVDIKENSKKIVIDNIYNYRLSGCSFLIPIAAFKQLGGFREDIRTVSDVEYWHRLIFSNYQFYCLKNSVLVKNRSHGKQVGKTKVELFNREIDSLYFDIYNDFERIFSPSLKDIKLFYFGLVKREIMGVAKYIQLNILKKRTGKIEYFFHIKLCSFFWHFLGVIRGVVRMVYRFVFVYRKE